MTVSFCQKRIYINPNRKQHGKNVGCTGEDGLPQVLGFLPQGFTGSFPKTSQRPTSSQTSWAFYCGDGFPSLTSLHSPSPLFLSYPLQPFRTTSLPPISDHKWLKNGQPAYDKEM